jgi:hypothetical protein
MLFQLPKSIIVKKHSIGVINPKQRGEITVFAFSYIRNSENTLQIIGQKALLWLTERFKICLRELL